MRAGRLRLLPHPAGLSPGAAVAATGEEGPGCRGPWCEPALEEWWDSPQGPSFTPAHRVQGRDSRSRHPNPARLLTAKDGQPCASGLVFNWLIPRCTEQVLLPECCFPSSECAGDCLFCGLCSINIQRAPPGLGLCCAPAPNRTQPGLALRAQVSGREGGVGVSPQDRGGSRGRGSGAWAPRLPWQGPGLDTVQ